MIYKWNINPCLKNVNINSISKDSLIFYKKNYWLIDKRNLFHLACMIFYIKTTFFLVIYFFYKREDKKNLGCLTEMRLGILNCRGFKFFFEIMDNCLNILVFRDDGLLLKYPCIVGIMDYCLNILVFRDYGLLFKYHCIVGIMDYCFVDLICIRSF